MIIYLYIRVYFKKLETIGHLNNLSAYLFWDVNTEVLDFDRNKKLIIERVLNLGLISDWHILVNTYGISGIAETAVSLRNLDKKAASFIALLSKIPQDQFLCFTLKQPIPEYPAGSQGLNHR